MGRISTLMLALFLCATTPAHAAPSLFGYIDGIAGISPTDGAHSDWIDVLAIQLPIAGGTTINTVGPITGNFIMTKAIDGTSASLAAAKTAGTVFNLVKIDIVDPAGAFAGVWDLTFPDILSIDPPPIIPAGPPIEEVSLALTDVKFTYIEFDNDGIEKGKVSFTWNPLDAPPIVSTQGTLDGFMLLNNVAVPEPGTLLLLTFPVLAIANRRRSC
jgi:type VI protein secretion system component Hcp